MFQKIEPSSVEIKNGAGYASTSVLVERIYQALWADKGLRKADYSEIGVKVQVGVVTLNGHVTTAVKKARVDNIVRRLSGVAQIENQLTVDDELTLAVAQALGYDGRMHGEQIDVSAQHGFVYLSGTASNTTLRQLAEQLAAGLPQVRGIINRIEAVDSKVNGSEERILQPAIGREVFATDCGLGRLQQVVISSHNRLVTELIVLASISTSLSTTFSLQSAGNIQPARSLIIPISAVRYASNGGIFLGVSSHEAAKFVDFTHQAYVSPPPDWQPPYPYSRLEVLLPLATQSSWPARSG